MLPAALVLLAVLLLLASTRFFVSHHQLDAVVRLSDGERAYQIAASGVRVAMGAVDRLIAHVNDPGADKAPPPLAGRFLDAEKLPRSDGAEELLSSAFIRHLQELPEVKDLEVTLSLSAGKPLFEGQPGSREAEHVLSIRARAEVGRSQGRLVAFKRLRLVDVQPGVAGKFVLWLRRQGELEAAGGRDSSQPGRAEAMPMVVVGGPAAPPGSLAPDVAGALLESQGWIFLGGEQTWSLGLPNGGGRPAFRAPLTPDLFRYPVEPGSGLASRGDIGYYARAFPLFAELGTGEQLQALAGKPAPSYSRPSVLSLMGSSSEPSPTLVVGRAYRRWALVQGIENRTTGRFSPLPWLDEATFATDRWPGGASAATVGTLRRQFGEDYSRYTRRMCDVLDEPYNAGNIAALAPAPGMERVLLPRGAPALPESKRLDVNGVPARFDGLCQGSIYTLKDETGRVVMSGGFDSLTELGFLTKKAALTYENAGAFLKEAVSGSTLAVGGAVLVKGALSLEKPLLVRKGAGGLILVEGPIRLARTLAAEAGEPVSLVSLTGDITVETPAPVNAALIALAGRVKLGPSFQVRGLIAAGELSVERSRDESPRRLVYNAAYDPTDSARRKAALRLMAEREWKRYVP